MDVCRVALVVGTAVLLWAWLPSCGADSSGRGESDATDASDTSTIRPADTTSATDTTWLQVDTAVTDTGSDETLWTCSAFETRCLARQYQTCVEGQYVTAQTCEGTSQCAPSLGCVACNPAAGKVCVGDEVHACNGDGSVGGLVERCLTQPCNGGSCGEAFCAPESQLIYVVDHDYRLLSFDPTQNTFTSISTLACPAGPSWSAWGNGAATPFSMSVDRSARAWVLYTSGEIFWVNTATGACERSPYSPGQQGYELFGMGFVTDSAGGSSEKLFISGGTVGNLGSGNVAWIDPTTLGVTTVGGVPSADYSPELTGTGNAKLFAYFPGTSSSFVAELSKTDGRIVQQWPLPTLGGSVQAWAFAHWGGRFYVFVTAADAWGSDNSQVLRLDPSTGQTETLLSNLPYVIVGAGVSTCAPWN